MITQEKAQQFAAAWISAWNSHDLAAIMQHYEEAVEFTSPFVVKILNNPSGKISEKGNVRAYFEQGLEAYPHLYFRLQQVMVGVDSITVVYHSVNGLLAAEVMEMSEEGKVTRVLAHYSPAEVQVA